MRETQRDPAYRRNVEALQAVQPKDLEPGRSAGGVTYIGDSYSGSTAPDPNPNNPLPVGKTLLNPVS